MNSYIRALLFSTALVAATASMAAKSVQLQEHQRIAFLELPGRVLTPAKVREAIAISAGGRGWIIDSQGNGEMILRNNVRGKHVVVVKVIYDGAGMQVDYVSSENLDYKLRHGVAYIHPKYNQWVDSLMKDVAARLSF